MNAHPIADLFPMLPDDELAELAADIAERGLLQPIVVDADGLLLDGRNRLAACERVGVEPAFVTYDGDDPAGYALVVNLARRHLNAGQRAMVAARAEALLSNGSHAASARGAEVSRGRVSQAATVLKHASDLADAVMAGTQPLNAAYEEARRRKLAADSDERKLARLAELAPDLADAVTEGRTPLNEALAAAFERDRKEQEDRRTARDLIERALQVVGDPGRDDFDAFIETWAGRLSPAGDDLPDRTARGAEVLRALSERIKP